MEDILRTKYTRTVFSGLLKELKLHMPEFNQSIYVYYAKDSSTHETNVKTLVFDLVDCGISSSNIFYDKWNHDRSIYQFQDKALKDANIAIIVGSSKLKSECESNGDKNYWTKYNMSEILKSKMIKIPVWFEDNFPGIYCSIPGLSFADDYFNTFFKFLECLYQLDPINNKVKIMQTQFNRILLNDDLFNAYKEREENERNSKNVRFNKVINIFNE